MDATLRNSLLLSSLLSLSLAACSTGNRGSVSSVGPMCAEQVLPNRFLVQWAGAVPKEFESLKLSPDSRVTRFSQVEKQILENDVLKKYSDQIRKAEHEFNVAPEDVFPHADGCDTVRLPTAWGPGDVKIQDAWSLLGKKGEAVTVAVVDSGADTNHPLLSSQIWTNPDEIPNNAVDDDRNGYVDDYKGFNFSNMTPDVSSSSTHGTHVSGIVAGQSGPLGFTGIAPKSKIMVLKFIDSDGKGSVGDAIVAMEYAQKYGARVINASWGGDLCSQILEDSIASLTSLGVVFVNASGNSGHDLAKMPEWPAVYRFGGKLTVGAHGIGQTLSSFSNYGQYVDVSAPGDAILSTVPPQSPTQPQGQMCGLRGTSMSTPFVSGLAAVLLSARPLMSAVDVVNLINAGVSTGGFGVRTQGKINALQSAQILLGN
ncbi:MAG: S8 family serine peptidase [Oligoflexia bacterium]|nr:S8 family serine peptidase [Oligoflexia bacterium]